MGGVCCLSARRPDSPAMLREEDLRAEGQSHLFDGAPAGARAEILAQLSQIDAVLPAGGLKGYLARARKLLQDAKAGTNPLEGKVPSVPEGESLTGARGPGSEAYAEFERLGMAELHSCAFCLVAGGMGERLGYPGIKIGITADLTSGKTFIEYYVDFILAFQAYARTATGNGGLVLPLAIMTSGDTHGQTVELLAAKKNFGMAADQITVMQQEKVPALMDAEARISAKDGKVETKPHGHGDVHALLHQKGIAGKWVGEGRKWLLLFQDTNPLPFRSFCAILGVSVRRNFTMNSLTVPRIPGEACGGICKLTGADGSSTTINVEYNILDPLLKSTPTGGDVADASGFSPYPGNINVLVFQLPKYVRCLETTGGIVPEFVNPKWADAWRTKFKSATRLESLMQDFAGLCGPGDNVGFTQLDRSFCFTCVKNNLADAVEKSPPDCALSAEADIYTCNARLLALAGADVEIAPPPSVSFLGITAKLGARIVMLPSWAISLEEMRRRVRGKVRISAASSLVLGGDVVLEGLDLDGSLTLRGAGAADLRVANAGCPLVAIPDDLLPQQPPSLRIRGYRVGAGETEQRTLP